MASSAKYTSSIHPSHRRRWLAGLAKELSDSLASSEEAVLREPLDEWHRARLRVIYDAMAVVAELRRDMFAGDGDPEFPFFEITPRLNDVWTAPDPRDYDDEQRAGAAEGRDVVKAAVLRRYSNEALAKLRYFGLTA
jgi:hypothetical protein